MPALFRLSDLVGDVPDWHELALCREVDPELFFPPVGSNGADAKRICWRCEVRAECAQDAIDRNEEFGIWGAISERERRQIKRRAA